MQQAAAIVRSYTTGLRCGYAGRCAPAIRGPKNRALPDVPRPGAWPCQLPPGDRTLAAALRPWVRLERRLYAVRRFGILATGLGRRLRRAGDGAAPFHVFVGVEKATLVAQRGYASQTLENAIERAHPLPRAATARFHRSQTGTDAVLAVARRRCSGCRSCPRCAGAISRPTASTR